MKLNICLELSDDQIQLIKELNCEEFSSYNFDQNQYEVDKLFLRFEKVIKSLNNFKIKEQSFPIIGINIDRTVKEIWLTEIGKVIAELI